MIGLSRPTRSSAKWMLQRSYWAQIQTPWSVNTMELFRCSAKKWSLLLHQSENGRGFVMNFCCNKIVTNGYKIASFGYLTGFLVHKSEYEWKSIEFTFTRAPITPRLVSRKYSNGRVLDVVFRNGYKNNGIWAFRKTDLVSGWDATHCNRANALQTRFDWWAVSVGGLIDG